jgi:hypothetical protein
VGNFRIVALGHRGSSGIWGRLLGGVADLVSDQAHCDVLIAGMRTLSLPGPSNPNADRGFPKRTTATATTTKPPFRPWVFLQPFRMSRSLRGADRLRC